MSVQRAEEIEGRTGKQHRERNYDEVTEHFWRAYKMSHSVSNRVYKEQGSAGYAEVATLVEVGRLHSNVPRGVPMCAVNKKDRKRSEWQKGKQAWSNAKFRSTMLIAVST